MASSPRIKEVKDYLQQGDNDLAIRRMLDLAWDSDDLDFIENTLQWSKACRAHLKQGPISLSRELISQGIHLLESVDLLLKWWGIQRELLVNAEQIEKRYQKGNFNLKPLDVRILTGEIIGVVGENGNGKTTFLSLLSGQLALTKGRIQYGFLQGQKPDYYTIQQQVSFVPQRIPRWYGLLKDNLHFSAAISGWKGKKNEVMVDFMLERMGLGHFANLTWDQISSGYRTRFEIARVLLQRPKLLILDEPLANLDINAQQTLLSDLRFMAKSARHPVGIVLSSQQLYEVEKTADSVLFLKNGECLHRTNNGKTAKVTVTVLEIETVTDRNTLVAYLGEQVQVAFNGGYYTLQTKAYNPQNLIKKLVEGNIPLTYLRDITHSTKRFF